MSVSFSSLMKSYLQLLRRQTLKTIVSMCLVQCQRNRFHQIRTRTTFSKSLMDSVGISKLGRTDLIFVDPGAKINGQYYRDVMLAQHLLPQMRHIAGDMFSFQQDSAPAHRARETIEYLSRNAPYFIGPEMWPPNSPDLNPLDYSIWSIMEQRVYQQRI